jgi:hypothetical protein
MTNRRRNTARKPAQIPEIRPRLQETAVFGLANDRDWVSPGDGVIVTLRPWERSCSERHAEAVSIQ